MRQGSPLSTLLFCTFIQTALETLRDEFPEIKIYAYIDDINMASTDSELLRKAFFRLWDLLAGKNVKLANYKCVWFEGKNGIERPEELRLAQVRTEKEAIKTLGVYIGEDSKVSDLLLQKLSKHKTIFARLKQMGANNVSSLILSKCVNIRHRFHIRAHTPESTSKLAWDFDGEVGKVISYWFGKLSKKQMAWARLPLKMGGFGLTSTYALREAAYASSRHAAFERRTVYSAQAAGGGSTSEDHSVPDEEAAIAAKINADVKEDLCKDPIIARIMASTTKKGSYQWLHATERYLPTAQYTLSVMPRLGLSHPKIPSSILCPGCKTVLNSTTALTHIPGCVRCSGVNSTVKHNSLARYIYELCNKAGIPCAREVMIDRLLTTKNKVVHYYYYYVHENRESFLLLYAHHVHQSFPRKTKQNIPDYATAQLCIDLARTW